MIKKILGNSVGYRLFEKIVGKGGLFRTYYVYQWMAVKEGEKVLDLGCGPGNILSWLPDVHYTGIDSHREYIESATTIHGSRGNFIVADLGDLESLPLSNYDVVMANGVLHHLDDEVASRTIHFAHKALKPGGRFVTHDGAFSKDQTSLEKWIVSLDRGQFIRRPENYLTLAKRNFTQIKSEILHKQLRIPYTHFLMHCTKS